MARPNAFEETLFKLVTSLISHLANYGEQLGHTSLASTKKKEVARSSGRFTGRWLQSQRTLPLLATSVTGLALRDGVTPSKVLGQIFARGAKAQPTAWANTLGSSRPITVRDGFLQGVCEAPLAFALALRVALTEFEDEIGENGLGLATALECWAYVDDVTVATTAPSSKKRLRSMAWNSETKNAQPIARLQKEHTTSEKK